MIINVIQRLKRDYPELYTSEQFGEYQLVLPRGDMVTKVILVGENAITGDLYASLLSVKVTRGDGVLDAVYDQGSTEFLFSSGDVMYSYTYRKNERKVIEITRNQLYRFLGGNVMDFIETHFRMKLGFEKLVEKLVTGA